MSVCPCVRAGAYLIKAVRSAEWKCCVFLLPLWMASVCSPLSIPTARRAVGGVQCELLSQGAHRPQWPCGSSWAKGSPHSCPRTEHPCALSSHGHFPLTFSLSDGILYLLTVPFVKGAASRQPGQESGPCHGVSARSWVLSDQRNRPRDSGLPRVGTVTVASRCVSQEGKLRCKAVRGASTATQVDLRPEWPVLHLVLVSYYDFRTSAGC